MREKLPEGTVRICRVDWEEGSWLECRARGGVYVVESRSASGESRWKQFNHITDARIVFAALVARKNRASAESAE